MVRNPELLEQFEREYAANEVLTLEQKFAILNGMYELAKTLGVFPLKDPFDGVEDDIRLARILNSV